MSIFSNPHGRAPEAARAYVDAVLEIVGERDPIELLAAFPEKLSAATAGLPDDVLRRPERDGKWSIIEVTKHLADTELVYAFRFRIALAQEKPPITGFDQDGWVRRLGYRSADLGETLSLHRVVRNANVALLRSLQPPDFERAGMHEERGEESVGLMVKLAAGHDIIHLRQIERIRAAFA